MSVLNGINPEEFQQQIPSCEYGAELDYFLSQFHCDISFVINAIIKSNVMPYSYLGNLQNGLYYVSDRLRDAMGLSSNLVESLPEKWEEFIHHDRWKQVHKRDHQRILENKDSVHDIWYQITDRTGTVRWIHEYEWIQWNEDKTKAIFVVGRLGQQDLCFTVDPLTNLPDQSTLHRRLEELQRENESCMTIGFTLNHMAEINSSCHRQFGDRLVHDVAEALMDKLTDQMTFYRLGGMRFLAIVDKTVTKSPKELVGAIRSIIDEGYRQKGIQAYHNCYFATMQFPQVQMTPEDYTEMMHSLLKLSENTHTADFLEESQENQDQIREYFDMRSVIGTDVFQGMKNFRAVIQPIVSAQTGEIIGGETLMRWKYRGKDISPVVFIPLLEETHLMHIAGRWIAERAVEACAQLVRYVPDCYLSANLSMDQLDDEGLFQCICDALDRHKLDARRLVLEITESSEPKDSETLLQLIQRCQEQGISLALDDYGSGYSALKNLLYYNLHFIKFDRSLLQEMEKAEERPQFFTSLVELFHSLEISICIEGVETEQQRQLAREIGCDYIQGFYFYRPSELPEILERLEEKSR